MCDLTHDRIHDTWHASSSSHDTWHASSSVVLSKFQPPSLAHTHVHAARRKTVWYVMSHMYDSWHTHASSSSYDAHTHVHAARGKRFDVFGRLEVERLRLHDLRFKLAVAKQMEVDRDIANTTKEVAVQLDRDQMQTAWGIWRLYRSSMRQMDVTDCPVCALYEV